MASRRIDGIVIRDARPEEFSGIVQMIGEFRLDYENLSPEQFIVAEHEGRLVAFGRLKIYPDCTELGCVGVVPEMRSMGLGRLVVRELIERARHRKLPEVWITTDLVGYFEPMGFVPVPAGEAPDSLREKIKRFEGAVRSDIRVMRIRL
jgi:N-acetylglutamate synthase-like GNAT family acetyltransferase